MWFHPSSKITNLFFYPIGSSRILFPIGPINKLCEILESNGFFLFSKVPMRFTNAV